MLEYAHRFRLNESLAASITRSSAATGLVLAPLLAVAAVVAAAAGSVLPFLVALGGAATGVAALAVAGQLESMQPGVHLQNKVRMRYAPEAAAAAPAGRLTAPQPADRNGSDATSSASGASAASAAQQGSGQQAPAGEQQQPQQRPPSAFTDVGPDRQQRPPSQPQAVLSRRQSASLRLRQPQTLLQHRLGTLGRPGTLCGRPLTLLC